MPLRFRTFLIVMLFGAAAPAGADPLAPWVNGDRPFSDAASNIFPLAFGMDAPAAARALGTPLAYLRGRPGDETFLAIRSIGGGGFFPRADRLYLQFRGGRLTGFKSDVGINWMWR